MARNPPDLVTGPTVVFWDIDGTLLSTARAGVGALEDASIAVLGTPLELRDMHTAGLTDPEIARLIVSRLRPADEPTVNRFLEVYVDRLPERLLDRRGRVMTHVPEILAAVEHHPAAINALLTGNMRGGAEAKLASYDLRRWFPDPLIGGFGDDAVSREDIAAVAIDRVRAACGRTVGHVVVVGDTPADVRCGRAHGFATIAVATGVYGVGDLSDAGAESVLVELPPAAEFLAMVGLPPS